MPYEVNENMESDPGWSVLGTGAADFVYNAGSDLMDCDFIVKSAVSRYYQELSPARTADDDIYFEYKVKITASGAVGRANIGVCDSAEDNETNALFSVIAYTGAAPPLLRLSIFARSWNASGTATDGGPVTGLFLNTQYLVRAHYYRDAQKFEVKIYDSTGATLHGTSTAILSSYLLPGSMDSFALSNYKGSGNTLTAEIDDILALRTSGIFADDVEEDYVFDIPEVWLGATNTQGAIGGYFRALIENSGGANNDLADYFADIQIYSFRQLVFRGFLEDKVPKSTDDMGDIIEYYGRGWGAILAYQYPIETYAAQARSVIVANILTNYASDVSQDIEATTDSINRTFKGMTAADIVTMLANEVGKIWYVDFSKTLHWEDQKLVSTGETITEGTSDIIEMDFNGDIATTYNRVVVWGDSQAAPQPVGMAENPTDQATYNHVIELQVQKEELDTDAECEELAASILADSEDVTVGNITMLGYEKVLPGETIILSLTSPGVSGEYIIIETNRQPLNETVVIQVAGMADGVDRIMGRLVREMREEKAKSALNTTVTTRILRFYETLTLTTTTKIWSIDIGDTYILDHSTNSVLDSSACILDDGGTTTTLEVNMTE